MTKDNKKMFMIIVFLMSILGILVYMFLFTNLSLSGEVTTSLYAYLGNDNLISCDGELFYTSSESTYYTIDDDLLICNAYLYSLDSGEEVILEADDDLDTCLLGAVSILIDEDEVGCTTTMYPIENIKDAYYTIYGKILDEYLTFYLTDSTTCSYIEDDEAYYCYQSSDETIITFGSAFNYRLLKSSVKKYDDTIVITDYFMNIIDQTCYEDFGENNKNYDCSNYIEEQTNITVDSNFMKSYAALYEHTFEEVDGVYHWVSSIKIS